MAYVISVLDNPDYKWRNIRILFTSHNDFNKGTLFIYLNERLGL